MTDKKELVKVTDEGDAFENVISNEPSVEPESNIFETDDEFVLVSNLPGVERKNIKVKIEENNLVVFGKVNYRELADKKYILNETQFGHYFRRFKISDAIDVDKIEAAFENGQLKINLPKNERLKARTIQIQ